MPPAGPVRAFLSYTHEDHAWRDAVLTHLGWLRHRGRLDLFDDPPTTTGLADGTSPAYALPRKKAGHKARQVDQGG